ncbi:MAG: Gfo/Idh/MocA family protein [Bryobacteraceae bacterium]
MTALTRRHLLAGSPLLAARLPRRVRVAVIGLQGHPNEVIGPLDQLPDVELVAIADRSEAEIAKVRKNPRAAAARAYPDYRVMLDREKPDVVGVCNAADERAPAVLECSQRGLHWIAEKPLANSRAELEAIRKALAANPRIRFSMLLPMRFDSPYLALKALCASGEIGEVAQISSQKSYKWRTQPEWKKHFKSYGGTLPWIGSHMVDLMRWTSGREFTEVFTYQGQVGGFPEIGEMENTTGSVFRMDNGGVATLHMDFLRPEISPTHGDDRLRLAGTKGVAEYLAATGVTIVSEGRKPEVIRKLPDKRSVFVDFLESVYNGAAPGLSSRDIFRTCEIVLAARESAELSRAVKL